MLITAIVGIDMRNTLDMDATIKGFDLEKDNLENILNEIKDEYQIVGIPRGIIVGRGYEGENFQRIMEIQIPIALKH